MNISGVTHCSLSKTQASLTSLPNSEISYNQNLILFSLNNSIALSQASSASGINIISNLLDNSFTYSIQAVAETNQATFFLNCFKVK